MFIIIFGCIILIVLYVLYQTYPPFGGKTPIAIKQKSPNFVNGKFVNQIPTSMSMSFHDGISIVRDQLRRNPVRKPSQPLIPQHPHFDTTAGSEQAQITWFGHSAFFLQLSGRTILLDPMLGKSASPFPAVGPQRFSHELPVEIRDLPRIDMVVISHDHYDHLDYDSIKKLADKTDMFFVPLGLAAHLQKWGVAADHITELDWWQESIYKDITVTCTPSRHFSGRTLTDRFATLWASWVIQTDQTNVFFSGDTGYGSHFKQIADKYGSFDLTLLECGQYDPRWSTIHMTPEQTAQAHQDLRGKRMIPMHWGAFTLALHAWTDPIERVLAAGAKTDAVIMTPEIGEIVDFKSDSYPTKPWWRDDTLS